MVEVKQEVKDSERKLKSRPATDVYRYDNLVCIKQESYENDQKVEQLVYFDLVDLPVVIKWMQEVGEEIKNS